MCITPEQAYAAAKVFYPSADYIRPTFNSDSSDIVVCREEGAFGAISNPFAVAWGDATRYPPKPVRWRPAQVSDITFKSLPKCRFRDVVRNPWQEGKLIGVRVCTGDDLYPLWECAHVIETGSTVYSTWHQCEVVDE